MTALKDKHIACIGGGTGMHILLSGLKSAYPDARLSAVVSMMDSGGSTGRLRDEFGYLPPGDVRQCLVALSDAPMELRRLMQHRFESKGSLGGHSVGNIILTALKELTGGEYEAIEAMERLLRIRGKVYPITLTNCHLVATLSDGSMITGETNIDVPQHDTSLRITGLSLHPAAAIFEKTRETLESADAIVIGPGDLYTSIMPNLIVEGVVDAIRRAKERGAKIIYVVNRMTKPGETDGYSARDFVTRIQDTLDGTRIDAVIVNSGTLTAQQLAAYAAEQSYPVMDDLNGEYVVVRDDFTNKQSFARHHPQRLAAGIGKALELLEAR